MPALISFITTSEIKQGEAETWNPSVGNRQPGPRGPCPRTQCRGSDTRLRVRRKARAKRWDRAGSPGRSAAIPGRCAALLPRSLPPAVAAAGDLPATSGLAPRRPPRSGRAAASPWPCPRAAPRATKCSAALHAHPEARNPHFHALAGNPGFRFLQACAPPRALYGWGRGGGNCGPEHVTSGASTQAHRGLVVAGGCCFLLLLAGSPGGAESQGCLSCVVPRSSVRRRASPAPIALL